MLADISSVDAIYIVCGRTDMRKSIDGLCAIIQEQFSMELDHALFLFCGRKCDRIKAILKEPDGIEYYGAAGSSAIIRFGSFSMIRYIV